MKLVMTAWLALASAALSGYQVRATRLDLEQSVATPADVAGVNRAPAPAVHDPRAAEETLV